MSKIYCKECKYMDEGDSIGYIFYSCTHSETRMKGRTAIEPKEKMGDCYSVNANNDCPLYEPKTFWQNHGWKITVGMLVGFILYLIVLAFVSVSMERRQAESVNVIIEKQERN